MLVTGYIPLHRPDRPHDEYMRLGAPLLTLRTPMTAFLGLPQGSSAKVGANVTVRPTSLDECWMLPVAQSNALPATDNPEKDTAEFLAIQAQKTAWLEQAAAAAGEDGVMGWVDFGVMHVAGVCPNAIGRWARRLAGADRDRITVPSIWGPPKEAPDPGRVAWHFAGGALIVPGRLAAWFHDQVRWEAALLAHERGVVTWEVNLWAMVAAHRPDRFVWYPCDHDGSLFANGP